jgi:hypothetical protein
MDLLVLSESIESVAARTFDELQRKEVKEEDGIVEPKSVTNSGNLRWLLGIVLVLVVLIVLAKRT